MAESMKVLGNVWKNYLSLKSTLKTNQSNQKTLSLLGELKSAGNNKSPQDIVTLSAKALKGQASEKEESLSVEDSEKRNKLEALDQTLQQLTRSWKTDKKAELKRRVAQAKEQLRVLRMMAEQAAASGNKTQAKAIARQVAEIARGIAHAAKEIGKDGPSPADDGNDGRNQVATTTITITGPASAGAQEAAPATPVETVRADAERETGKAIGRGESTTARQVADDTAMPQAAEKDGDIFTATLQSVIAGKQAENTVATGDAAKGWHDSAKADKAAIAYAENSSLKELMREARNRIEEAKRILKFLSKMATKEAERQDYKAFDDEMRNLLDNLPHPNGEWPSVQADTVPDAADADGFSFTAQATTDSGVGITVSVTETAVSAGRSG